MSDILIKGMCMPKSCFFCPLYKETKGCCSLVSGYFRHSFCSRRDDCPLTEISSTTGSGVKLSLDDAIQHCKEKEDCSPCGEDHKQLRIWLEDYKRLKAKENAGG